MINVSAQPTTALKKHANPSGTFVPFDSRHVEQSIPDRFEQVVGRHGERLAVKTRNQSMTYDDLNHLANQVAHLILEQRRHPKEAVGLFLDDDVAIIAATLGVLKAGRTYVPLDPSYPRKRNSYILRDSQARLVITNTKNEAVANTVLHEGCCLLNMDTLAISMPDSNPGLSIPPDTLSYILYTSGSTGRPKGVVQNHRGQLHDIMTYTNSQQICSHDRLALLTSSTTGQGIQVIFGALLNGAGLFPFDVRSKGVVRLGQWLADEEITIYRSSATLFRHFVHGLRVRDAFPRIRIVRLGSEPVCTNDVSLCRSYFGSCCLFYNALATTETGTLTHGALDHQTLLVDSQVPVGYPVVDTEVLLLNEVGEPKATGEVGEIAVRSRYLSPGYWRRPDLTHAQFLPDPDGGDARIYRTGDLGRLLTDGCLVHVGRKDFQLNVLGYQVAPTEVEMHLLELDGIREAVVTSCETEPGGHQLVAYWVAASQPPPATGAVRHHLRKSLPGYMVPAVLIKLDALPLTPNGKVDRCALPNPEGIRPDLETTFISPQTSMEEALVKIWQEVLLLKPIGIHDRFLELGGNSLHAMQIASHVLDRLHVEMSLRDLFEAPTVADMATILTQNKRGVYRL